MVARQPEAIAKPKFCRKPEPKVVAEQFIAKLKPKVVVSVPPPMLLAAVPVNAVFNMYGWSGESPGFWRMLVTHLATRSITVDFPA